VNSHQRRKQRRARGWLSKRGVYNLQAQIDTHWARLNAYYISNFEETCRQLVQKLAKLEPVVHRREYLGARASDEPAH
jgi:hypothetical protein